jgi:uncharacterized membrane protein YedE/YeeE
MWELIANDLHVSREAISRLLKTLERRGRIRLGRNEVELLTALLFGGFLVGFGARWAGGCTSGHAISGLSNLQLPSLIAVIGFFIGGLIMSWLILPLMLQI